MTWDGAERRLTERRLRIRRDDEAKMYFGIDRVPANFESDEPIGACDAGAFVAVGRYAALTLADLLALAGFMRRVAAGDTKTEA